MKYYSTWQEALAEFIEQYGHNYKDAYTLTAEFEQLLFKNVKGAYYVEKPWGDI